MGGVASFILLLASYLPALQRGITGAADILKWGVEAVKVMVEEGRDPTPEEWAVLKDSRSDMMAALMSDDF